jgi:hypothetical protein
MNKVPLNLLSFPLGILNLEWRVMRWANYPALFALFS